MVETNGSKFVLTKSDLLAPKNNLVVPDRKKITSGDLLGIFGVDVRLLTQDELIRLGILPKGNELLFSNDPIIHTYTEVDENGKKMVVESDGQYFIETVIGKDGVLVSFLPPYSKTSEHEHTGGILERYRQIAGQSVVNIGGEKFTLNAGMEARVPIETEHQVTTDKMPGFMLIIMENAGLVPRSQWHRSTRRL